MASFLRRKEYQALNFGSEGRGSGKITKKGEGRPLLKMIFEKKICT